MCLYFPALFISMGKWYMHILLAFVNVKLHTTTNYVKQVAAVLTDSERPHHCWHLTNNFGSRWIFRVLYNGPGGAPRNYPFPLGYGYFGMKTFWH